jgi:hypothetical protein
MINILKKRIQILNGEFTQYEPLCVNAGNEHQAMSCGAFNPLLLARLIKVKSIANTEYVA